MPAIIPIFFLMYGINDTIAVKNQVFLSQKAKDGFEWTIMVLISGQISLALAFQIIDSWDSLKTIAQTIWEMLKKFAYYSTGLNT